MKTPLFTETDFKNWLVKQPNDRSFRYGSTSDCLIASFLKEHFDVCDVNVGGYNFNIPSLELFDINFTFIGPWLTVINILASNLGYFDVKTFSDKYKLTSGK